MEDVIFRRAHAGDVAAASAILVAAAKRMMAQGKQQWDDNYPTEKHVVADVERGVGYVLERDGRVVAYGAVVTDGEPSYAVIDGAWLSDMPYVVVHRMAVAIDCEGLGLGRLFLNNVERFASERGIRSFRVDTNFDNFAMLHLLEKTGFTYCGEIYYEGGSRKAFEKLVD